MCLVRFVSHRVLQVVQSSHRLESIVGKRNKYFRIAFSNCYILRQFCLKIIKGFVAQRPCYITQKGLDLGGGVYWGILDMQAQMVLIDS